MTENEQAVRTFSLPSVAGNERLAAKKIEELLRPLGLSLRLLERIKTAVAETAMNAIEHGNRYHEDLPVTIETEITPGSLYIRIADYGGQKDTPMAEEPDIDAKLAGIQSPRGWGLFLIHRMADDVRFTTDKERHTVELTFFLVREGDSDFSI